MSIEKTQGKIAITLSMVLWGFNFVATKVAVGEISPFSLLLFRLLCASVLFLGIARMIGRKPLRDIRQHWRRIFPLAFLGIAVNQLFFLWGLSNTTPSHSALVYTLLPIFTVLFDRLITGKTISGMRWAGIGIGFIGAAWLATEGRIDFSSDYMAGDSLTLTGAVCFALFLVLAKPVLQDLGVMAVLPGAYVLALPPVLLITILPAMQQSWSAPSALAWGGAIYLVLGGTVGAYLLHQFALRHLPAALIAAFAYAQPLFATLFSVLLLGERITPPFVVAAVLILVGLILVQKRSGADLQPAAE